MNMAFRNSRGFSKSCRKFRSMGVFLYKVITKPIFRKGRLFLALTFILFLFIAIDPSKAPRVVLPLPYRSSKIWSLYGTFLYTPLRK